LIRASIWGIEIVIALDDMQSDERLIRDTSRLPIWLRSPILILGLFTLWLSAHEVSSHLFAYDLGLHFTGESGSSVLGFILTLGLGLFFISIWFLRNRTVFDSSRAEIVIYLSLFFWHSKRRIPHAGANGIRVEFGRALARTFWNINIEFNNGRREWITQIYRKPNEIAKKFSEATQLPILKP
jgi:hypothetical protein